MKKFYAFSVLFKSLFKTTWQLLYGVHRVSQLEQPIVTIFGGARVKQGSEFGRQAHELAHMLIKDEISVITGGGPGIMEAANCGASHELREQLRLRNIGVTVAGLDDKEELNKCAQEQIVMDYFFARKWLLINYSVAFAIFPGGFGTLDELAEVVTLMQTKKLPGVPVVLIGKEFWQPLIDWLSEQPLKHGLISKEDLELLHVTDDLVVAHRILKERCETCTVCVHELEK